NLSDGVKVIALTNNFGNHFITIYDMDANGILTQRAFTQLNNDPGISITGSNIIYSPQLRTGFVSLSSGNIRLVSFSVDTGLVLQTLVTPVSAHLKLFEDGSRRMIVGGLNRTLVFVDYSNPSQMHELGRVDLPTNGAFFGTWEMSPVFSSDGNYVFTGNGFTFLSAIRSDTRQIVGSINNDRYRVNQLRSFQAGNDRFLMMRGLEDGTNVLKGFALIKATDPSNLLVTNEMALGENIFAARDFCISRDAKRIFVASYAKLTTYSLPQFTPYSETVLNVFDAVKVLTFGQRERVLGAWWNKIYSIPNKSNITSNFDLDAKSDLGTFRPAQGTWQWLRSSDNMPSPPLSFGQQGDVTIPGDYDGDGKTDVAIYRPLAGQWRILESSTGVIRQVNFGLASDVPVPADYDGDGKVDPAVFRRNPNRWLVLRSGDAELTIRRAPFGRLQPIAGDYDGDGKADFVSFLNGTWTLQMASGAISTVQFGQTGDIPLAGDFDNDWKTDVAVFSPTTQTWRIQQSFAGLRVVQFGQAVDQPVPADYDGDGKTDISVYRSSTSTWEILQSSSNTTRTVQFGLVGDVPLTRQ
ncbi:MAG: VCBS repeat-containing protein, partial [Pirellulaceae bacterium]